MEKSFKTELVADKLFKAKSNLAIAESEFEEFLDKIFGDNWGFDHYSYDAYDMSFELIDAENNFYLNKDQFIKFQEVGFLSGYVQYKTGHDVHYYSKKPEGYWRGLTHYKRNELSKTLNISIEGPETVLIRKALENNLLPDHPFFKECWQLKD